MGIFSGMPSNWAASPAYGDRCIHRIEDLVSSVLEDAHMKICRLWNRNRSRSVNVSPCSLVSTASIVPYLLGVRSYSL